MELYGQYSRTDKTIMYAFQRVMGRMPIDKIGISDICQEADIQRATFYNHFENKEHLFKTILFERQASILKQALNKDENPTFKDCIEVIWEELIEILGKESARIKYFYTENQMQIKYMNMVNDSLIENFEKIFSYYKDSLKHNTNIHIASLFYVAALSHLLLNWLFGKLKYNKEEMKKICLTSLLALCKDEEEI